jgi:uncharacterized protein (DUF1501 family)
MSRRDFLKTLGAGCCVAIAPGVTLAAASAPGYDNLLVLVELKGGNDGLNTVVPYADREYYNLRLQLAIPRDQVLKLDERVGLHPAMQALMPLWQQRQLAVIQGVGYAQPNLSHFRSIEIWDTASNPQEYLDQGWLARAFATRVPPPQFAADGVVLGSQELGPLAGSGARVVSLANPQRFFQQAKLAQPEGSSRNPALEHILKVERDIVQAAARLSLDLDLKTAFPQNGFGTAMKAAVQLIGGSGQVAVVKVSLSGFDTHSNQLPTQQRLLQELSEGLAAFRAGLMEVGRWDRTLVLTYAEFGRRPRANLSNGTDHGTANVHFALGGRVNGGLYGQPPQLTRLDGNGNLAFAVDYRSLYATALERWWGVPSADVLRGRYPVLDLLRA